MSLEKLAVMDAEEKRKLAEDRRRARERVITAITQNRLTQGSHVEVYLREHAYAAIDLVNDKDQVWFPENLLPTRFGYGYERRVGYIDDLGPNLQPPRITLFSGWDFKQHRALGRMLVIHYAAIFEIIPHSNCDSKIP